MDLGDDFAEAVGGFKETTCGSSREKEPESRFVDRSLLAGGRRLGVSFRVLEFRRCWGPATRTFGDLPAFEYVVEWIGCAGDGTPGRVLPRGVVFNAGPVASNSE